MSFRDIHPKFSFFLKRHYKTNPLTDEIILLHDFDHNHHLFEVTMAFLLQKEATFLPFNVREI